MMDTLLNLVFRCQHKRLSRPITPPRSATYVVCLECGKQFDYDMKTMRMAPRGTLTPQVEQHPSV